MILGETCCGREGNLYANFIESELGKNVIVKSVKMGKTESDDFTYSLTYHPFEQVSQNCGNRCLIDDHWIALDRRSTSCAINWSRIQISATDTMPLECLRELCFCAWGAKWFNWFITNGSTYRRGLAQICPYPPMRNLISLGGPQQGANHYPRCEQMWGAHRCDVIKQTINFKAYKRYARWVNSNKCRVVLIDDALQHFPNILGTGHVLARRQWRAIPSRKHISRTHKQREYLQRGLREKSSPTEATGAR